MAEVERIWRVTTQDKGSIELRLFTGPDGEHQVVLDQLGSEAVDGAFDIEVARALAQAMFEACEVASALSEQLSAVR